TCVACRWEPGSDVIRLARRLIVLQVTGDARHLSGAKAGRAVTRLAGELTVRNAERHAGHRAVFPLRGSPARGPVTLLALRAELEAIAIVLAARPVTVEAARGRA